MKKIDFGKLFDNGDIQIIGQSEMVVTAIFYNSDTIYNYNLAINGDRNKFKDIGMAYKMTEQEIDEVILKSYALF